MAQDVSLSPLCRRFFACLLPNNFFRCNALKEAVYITPRYTKLLILRDIPNLLYDSKFHYSVYRTLSELRVFVTRSILMLSTDIHLRLMSEFAVFYFVYTICILHSYYLLLPSYSPQLN
jgi:hypothetical protein